MRGPPRRSNSPVRTPPHTRSHGNPPLPPRASATPGNPPRASATPRDTPRTNRTDRNDRAGDTSGYTRRGAARPDCSPRSWRRSPLPPPPPPSGGAGSRSAFRNSGAGTGVGGIFGGPPPSRPAVRSTIPISIRRWRWRWRDPSYLGEPIYWRHEGSRALSPVGGGRPGPNAVIGVFDRRGHLNFRIVARTAGGIPVLAPGGTSVSLHNINLRWPSAGVGTTRLRAMIEQRLRLPRDRRP
ncbi:hypothetical protein VE04_08533 [Pseudogymnoascus sp. 24MN13]|nr:hypothetical protein VE04_08533 [Pseudogymnoascus sp. 24MN13]